MVPAAPLLLPTEALCGLAAWRAAGRAIEHAVRRRGWPARGYYTDRCPPADLPAVAARRVALRPGPASRGEAWFVPFAGGDLAQVAALTAAEPPAEIAAAAVRAWRCLGATADHVADVEGPQWVAQFRLHAETSGPVGAIIGRQTGLGRGLRREIGRSGYLVAGGEPVMASAWVEAGSSIVALTPPRLVTGPAPEPGCLTIAYEDEHLLVVDKPAGVLVHPAGRTTAGTLANYVAAHLAAGGQAAIARPVGRLDRGTSGLVVFAKSRYAHQALAAQRQAGRFRRTYLALSGPASHGQGDAMTFSQPVVSPPSDPERYLRPRAAATRVVVLLKYQVGLVLQVELLNRANPSDQAASGRSGHVAVRRPSVRW